MDDTKDAANALDALVKNGTTARTKMGRLRQLLPSIEAAQDAGISHEQILVALNERGLDLKLGPYSTMLWRIRHGKTKAKGSAAGPPSVPTANAAAGFTPGKEDSKPESTTTEPELSDALETQRRRDEKSRRFISDANPLVNRLRKNQT